VLGKPADFVLREDLLAVDRHVKHATAALDEHGLDALGLLDLGRQTGGARQIISGDAVFDRDLHG
jgi:hypothetical protein